MSAPWDTSESSFSAVRAVVDPKVTSALWAAMPKPILPVADLRGMPPSSRSGRAPAKPSPLSIKLFFPYCDAICDSTADARQSERVTS